MPALILTSRQRSRLRALAHSLKPVVLVGESGLSDGIARAVDQALTDHELIKVQMRQPENKKALAQAIAEATNAALCGLVGHTLILYRPHPDKPRIQLG
jgi:RNA-binding protein